MAETTSSWNIYNGRVFDVRVDTIRDGDVEYKPEIVVHRGSAVIVPEFDDKTVALVRQYRHAAGRYSLEVPASNSTSSRAHGEYPFAGSATSMMNFVQATHFTSLTSSGFATGRADVYPTNTGHISFSTTPSFSVR